MKASILRFLMRIGMIFHGYPFPLPPRPKFTRTIPASKSSSRPLKLIFYTPKWYERDVDRKAGVRYPVVVNFHGGGFSIGRATDDARWARIITERTNAVVVSVEYSLAPEHPFPAAVDDGVRALLYLESRASELSLDVSRISLSGFSAGGNLAFAVPLRLQASLYSPSSSSSSPPNTPLTQIDSTHHSTPLLPFQRHRSSSETENEQTPLQKTTTSDTLRIISIISWYPILDYVLSRTIRRDRSIIPSKTLSPFLTNFFDNSYLPNELDRASPYASPLRATSQMLTDAIPSDVFIYMCEWDMLLHEGKEFVTKLTQSGKKVRSMMIDQSTHAWDKSANPFRDQGSIDVFYHAAAEQLERVFEEKKVHF